MRGLLKKDLLLLKSQIKYIVMIVVICLIMAYANSGFASISSYLTFMGTGLVFNSFSYDMYHNEMAYLFALPFSKKEYCIEKYIYALSVTFISWLIAFLITSISHINLETVIVQLAMLFSGFIYLSITIPVVIRYGREKATIIVLMLVLLLFLAVASGATSVGMLMSNFSGFILIGIYALIVLIALIISYRSTITILNDKEPLHLVAVLFVYILSNHDSK